MVHRNKTPWMLLIGVSVVGYAWLVQPGMTKETMDALTADEMVTMGGYIFGAIGIVIGLWQLAAKPKEGHTESTTLVSRGAIPAGSADHARRGLVKRTPDRRPTARPAPYSLCTR